MSVVPSGKIGSVAIDREYGLSFHNDLGGSSVYAEHVLAMTLPSLPARTYGVSR